jgi:hypothetical protein
LHALAIAALKYQTCGFYINIGSLFSEPADPNPALCIGSWRSENCANSPRPGIFQQQDSRWLTIETI